MTIQEASFGFEKPADFVGNVNLWFTACLDLELTVFGGSFEVRSFVVVPVSGYAIEATLSEEEKNIDIRKVKR